jgi:hypothetical protein
MIKNKKGDRGHPCCSPWEDLKKGEGTPLVRTLKEGDSIHPIIQLTDSKFIPNLIKASSMKV